MQAKLHNRLSSLLQPHAKSSLQYKPGVERSQATSDSRVPPAGFHLLPQEILDRIFDCLCLQDLRSFALCSRYAYTTVVTIVYGTIALDMSRADFRNTLLQWTELLQRRCVLALVRTIRIKGRSWTHGPSILEPDWNRRLQGDMANTQSSIHRLMITVMNRSYMDDYSLLVKFLRKLPRIRTIELDLDDVLPPMLLTAFKDEHATSRICLSNVLFTPHLMTGQEVINQFRLPNLTSVSVVYHQLREIATERILFLYTFQLLSRHLSRLKHLEMQMKSKRCGSWCCGVPIPDILGKPLRSTCFQRKLEDLALSQIQLRSLAFQDPSPVLEHLGRYVDISNLRTLRLYGFLGPDLNWASAHCYFTSLQELEIRMQLEFEDIEQWEAATKAVKRFVLSVPPLRCLKVLRVGRPDDLKSLLEYHGSSLRSLTTAFYRDNFRLSPSSGIYYTSESSDIIAISEYCPILQLLDVEVRRTSSNHREKVIYQSLGHLSKLRRLTLNIDCTFLAEDAADFEAGFRNSAMDRAFAKSIWNLITEDNNAKRLETLHIYPQSNSGIHKTICNTARRSGFMLDTKQWSILMATSFPKLNEICHSMEVIKTYELSGTTGLSVKYVAPRLSNYRSTTEWRSRNWQHNRLGMEDMEREAIKSVWNVNIDDSGWQDHCSSIPFTESSLDSVHPSIFDPI